MRRTTFFTLTALSMLAGLILWVSPTYAAEGGTLKGKLTNATEGGGSVAGVEVTLTTYFGQTERNKATVKTDAEGNFQFTGLDTNASYSYGVTTNYQKTDYSASSVSFSGTPGTKDVTLQVYDSTTDEGVLSASAKHYLISLAKGGELEVSEILVLANTSDRSYIGSREIGPDQRETVRYMPASGARSVEYGEGLMSCCIVRQEAGFVDTMAVKPGEGQTIYSYRIPYSGTAASFSSVLQQTTERVQVLVPASVQASIVGLSSHGTQNIQGTTYQVFGADRMPASTKLEVQLEGLPANQFSDSPLVLAGIVLGTVAALGAAFYLLRKRSQRRPAFSPAYGYHGYPPAVAIAKRGKRAAADADSPRGVSANPALLELEKGDLLAAIANLDERFEAGSIGRRDYERLRAEKKERLLALMRHPASPGVRG